MPKNYRVFERIVLIGIGVDSTLSRYNYAIENYQGLFLQVTTPVRQHLSKVNKVYYWFSAKMLGDYEIIKTSDYPYGLKFGDEIRLNYAVIRKTSRLEKTRLNHLRRKKLHR